ncbi:MAG TPA: DUF2809 domain-containing protein [Herpetosiphonaceae bacterium]|nr:DUF2809 domain-containing protein [Herpetosiphonaceae bacterium]
MIGIVALGILSRLLPVGNVLFDKYLGDALYAAMLFELVLLARPRLSPWRAAALAFGLVCLIELFQLTNIPLALRDQGNPLLRTLAVVLGMKFDIIDIIFYAAGIAGFLAPELYGRWRSGAPDSAG